MSYDIATHHTAGFAWPWVDVDRTRDEPLPPVTDADDRPAVRDLIAKHSKAIEAVRHNLEDDPLYDPSRHDDLWVLRFVLSHNKVKPATAAAKSTLKYRLKRGFDQHDIRADWPGPNCSLECVRKYYSCLDDDALVFSLPHPDRGIAVFIRLAGFDQRKLVELLTVEEWPFWYTAEWTFQQVDSITRRTGRLTKTFRCVDLNGIRMKQIDRENMKRNGAAAKEFEDNYPQLLKALYVCNAPSWIQAPFKLFRPLMPKRFLEKFNFVNPENKQKDAQLFLKFMSAEHVPTRFGGNYLQWPVPAQIVTAKDITKP